MPDDSTKTNDAMDGVLDAALAALLPALLMAMQRKPEAELDVLFAQLRTASGKASAQRLIERIWACWMAHDDPGIGALMKQGIEAIEAQHFDEALQAFDAVIERDPAYAEGWNKRATVHYLLGTYAASVRDIKRTLALEPRHFGALSGLGTIYLMIANNRGALHAFEAVLAINPHLHGVRRQVDALRQALDTEDEADDGAA